MLKSSTTDQLLEPLYDALAQLGHNVPITKEGMLTREKIRAILKSENVESILVACRSDALYKAQLQAVEAIMVLQQAISGAAANIDEEESSVEDTDQEIFEVVRDVLVTVSGEDEIQLDSTLDADLALESIDILDIFCRLEDKFRIMLPREEFLLGDNQLTVEGLYNFVRKKVAESEEN